MDEMWFMDGAFACLVDESKWELLAHSLPQGTFEMGPSSMERIQKMAYEADLAGHTVFLQERPHRILPQSSYWLFMRRED